VEDGGDLADAAGCGGMSFSAGTRVLLASGAAIPISQLKPGRKVLATNTKTGKTSAEPVAAVLVHHDSDRYDLTVKTAHGTAVINTTSSHLFWNFSLHKFIPASHLKTGMRLKTANGTTATIIGGSVPPDSDGWMWDLTIPGNNDHDFYVTSASNKQNNRVPYYGPVGTTFVLVHNDDGCLLGAGDIPRKVVNSNMGTSTKRGRRGQA
jgi:Pretoxin HINT domain